MSGLSALWCTMLICGSKTITPTQKTMITITRAATAAVMEFPRMRNDPSASLTCRAPRSARLRTGSPAAILSCCLLLAALGASLAGAQDTGSPAVQTPDTNTSKTGRSPAIEIGPGDLLDIVVFDTPELSSHVRVAQDGFANLPVLGRINLSGLNADQAARKLEIEFRQRNLLLDPHVTVFIAEYASQGATVTGEVRTPGIYPTLGRRKLLDMLAIAGGVSATAGKSVSIIHRDDPDHPLTAPLQARAELLGTQENPP